MNDDKARLLFDALSEEYDMGEYEQFVEDIKDDEKRRMLYDAISDTYDVGKDYNDFTNKLGIVPVEEAPYPEEVRQQFHDPKNKGRNYKSIEKLYEEYDKQGGRYIPGVVHFDNEWTENLRSSMPAGAPIGGSVGETLSAARKVGETAKKEQTEQAEPATNVIGNITQGLRERMDAYQSVRDAYQPAQTTPDNATPAVTPTEDNVETTPTATATPQPQQPIQRNPAAELGLLRTAGRYAAPVGGTKEINGHVLGGSTVMGQAMKNIEDRTRAQEQEKEVQSILNGENGITPTEEDIQNVKNGTAGTLHGKGFEQKDFLGTGEHSLAAKMERFNDIQQARDIDELEQGLKEAYAERDLLKELIEEQRGTDREISGLPGDYMGYAIRPGGGLTELDTRYRLVQDRINALEAKRDGGGFWKGFVNAISDPSLLSMGVTSAVDATRAINVFNSLQNNEELSKYQQKLISDMVLSNEAEEKYGDDLGFLYTAGNISANAIPFMLEFMLFGGGVGIAEAVEKGVTKIAPKVITKALGKHIVRALGATAGDIAAAVTMANTTGGARTYADIVNRYIGRPIKDENREYKFEGGKDLGQAIYEGEVASILEYYTEMLGNRMEGPAMAWLAKKGGLSKIADVYAKLTSSSKVGKAIGTTLRAAGINSLPNEGLEEEANIILNSLLVGDNQFSDLWDAKTQRDIWGGMLFSVGSMSAMQVLGDKVGTYNEHQRLTNNLNIASAKAGKSIGSGWKAMQERMDGTSNEDFADLAGEITDNENLTTQQKRDALEYMGALAKLRGFNTMTVINAREEANRFVDRQDAMSTALKQGYDRGASALDQGGDPHKIQVDVNAAAANVTPSTKATIDNLIDNNATPQELTDVVMQLPEGEREGAMAYVEARSSLYGIQDVANEDVQQMVMNEQEAIAPHIQETTDEEGNVHKTFTTVNYNGQTTYVRNYDPASPYIHIVDPVTGEVRQIIKGQDDALDESSIQTYEYDQYMNDFERNTDNAISQELEERMAHNSKTDLKMKQGNLINTENGQMYVFSNDGQTVQLLPTQANAETNQIEPVSGQPITMRVDDAVAMQDTYNDGVDYGMPQAEAEEAPAEEAQQEEQEQEQEQEPVEATEEEAAVEAAAEALRQAGLNNEIDVLNEGGRLDPNSYSNDELNLLNNYLEALNKLTEVQNRQQEVAAGGQAEGQAEGQQEAPATESALSRIPKDDAGNYMYESAPTTDTYDALVEQVGETGAMSIAQSQAAAAKKTLDELTKQQNKGELKGNTVQEQIVEMQALQQAINDAQAKYDYWIGVQGVPDARATAGAEEEAARKEQERTITEGVVQKMFDDGAKFDDIRAVIRTMPEEQKAIAQAYFDANKDEVLRKRREAAIKKARKETTWSKFVKIVRDEVPSVFNKVALAMTGHKFLWETQQIGQSSKSMGIGAIFNNGSATAEDVSNWVASKENGGETFDAVVHKIWEDEFGIESEVDTSEIANIVTDILLTYRSPMALAEFVVDTYEKQMAEHEEEAKDAFAQEFGFSDYESMETYDELGAEEINYIPSDDEYSEIISIFADENEQEQSNNEGTDGRTEESPDAQGEELGTGEQGQSGSEEGGSEVRSGEGADETGTDSQGDEGGTRSTDNAGDEVPGTGESGTRSEREQFIAEHPLTEAEIDASDAPNARKNSAKRYLNGTDESQLAKAAYLSIYNKKPKITTAEPETAGTEDEGNAAADAAKAKLQAILARLNQHKKKPNKDGVNEYSIESLTPEQVDDMLELVEAGAEYGYQILDAVSSKKEWKGQISDVIKEPLQNATGYTDQEVDELIEDIWDSQYENEWGDTNTIKEYAEEKGIDINDNTENNGNEEGNDNSGVQAGESGSDVVGGTAEGGTTVSTGDEGSTESSGETSNGEDVSGGNRGSSEGQSVGGSGSSGKSGTNRGTSSGSSGKQFQENAALENKDRQEEDLLARAKRIANEQWIKAVTPYIEKWSDKLGIPIHVITDVSQIPDHLGYYKKAIEDGKGYRAWYVTYKDGTDDVYIYVPNTSSYKEIDGLIMHEIVAHKGLKGLLGEEGYKNLCLKVYDEMSPEEKEKWRNYGSTRDIKDDEERNASAGDEYIANLAETMTPENSTWDRIVSLVRGMLRKMGINLKISNEELSETIRESYRNLTNPDPNGGGNTREDDDLSGKNGIGALLDAVDRRMKEVVAFKEATSTPSGTIETVTSDDWDRVVSDAANQLRTTIVDMYTPLKRLQELLSKKLGIKITDTKNVHQAMLNLSSLNLSEMGIYDRMIGKRLSDAAIALMGKKAFKKNGEGMDKLNDYMYAKHAVERNREKAMEDYANSPANTNPSLMDLWYQDKEAIYNDPTMTWREKQEALDDLLESYGVDYHKTPSMGLAAIFGMEEKDDWRTEAYDYVEAFERSKDPDAIKEYWDAVRAATDYILDKGTASGMYSQDFKENQHKRWQYYVPLRGFDEVLAQDVYAYAEETSPQTNGSLKAPMKGRKSKAGNIFGAIVSLGYSSIIKGNENLAKQRFLNLAREAQKGGSKLMKVNETWAVKYGELKNYPWIFNVPTDKTYADDEFVQAIPMLRDDMTPEEAQEKLAEFYDKLEELEENDDAARVHGKGKIPYRTLFDQDKQHQVAVYENGRRYTVTMLGDNAATQAINGWLNPGRKAGEKTRIVKSINRFMSSNFTSRNPAFAIANIIRDSQFASNNVWVKENMRYLGKYFANLAECYAAVLPMFARYQLGELKGGNSLTQRFKEFMDNGGPIGYTFTESQEDYAEKFAKATRERANQIQKMRDLLSPSKLANPKMALENVLKVVEAFSEASELINRFAAYKTSREMGRSITRSILDAHEVSINFAQKGAASAWQARGGRKTKAAMTAASMLTSYGQNFVIFFNANIQGRYIAADNLFANMVRGEKGKAAKAFFSQAVIPTVTGGVGMAMLNDVVLPAIYQALGLEDGDDDDKYYDELNDYTRHNKLCLRLPGHSWLTVPVDPEAIPMWTIGDLLYNIYKGRDVSSEDIMRSMVDAMSPINMEWERGRKDEKDVFLSIAPSALKPAAELMMNQNFLGYTIYKEDPYNTQNGVPKYKMVTDYTSETLVKLSELSNRLGGGNSIEAAGYRPGEGSNILDWNPAVLQHILKSYAGGLPETILGLVEGSMQILTGGSFAEGTNKIPLVSRFYMSGNRDLRDKRINSAFNQIKYTYDEGTRLLNRYDKLYDEAEKEQDPIEKARKLTEYREGKDKKEADEFYIKHAQLVESGVMKEIKNKEKALDEATKKGVDEDKLYDMQEEIMILKESVVDYMKTVGEDYEKPDIK